MKEAMGPNDDELTLEGLDDQIDWHARASRALPLSPTPRLIQGLRRFYENEQADEQSVEAVRQRLAERGAVLPSLRQRSLQVSPRQSQPGAWQPRLQSERSPRRRWPLASRLTMIAAAVVLIAVIGGLTVGLILVRQPKVGITSRATTTPGQTVAATSTLPPAPPAAITYIGRDGNIWEMVVPNGTPQQWTNQARAGVVQYSGLVWSPDGSRLAALRTTATKTPGVYTYTLIIFSSDGTVLHHVSLPGVPDNVPFAWSPGGSMVAYRQATNQYNAEGRIGKLSLIDAASGQIMKTLDFIRDISSGCGRGYVPALISAIEAQHHAYEGIDTFAWSHDQNSILVAFWCTNSASARVDLNTDITTQGFPEGASYQPGGNLIVGSVAGNAIELVDVTGKNVRTLVSYAGASGPFGPGKPLVTVGRALWSRDGQSVYYEYKDSIWQINVDGTNAHMVVPGTALDNQNEAVIQLLGGLSSKSHMLLYLQVKGTYDANDTNNGGTVASQWYVAQADGSNPLPLPQGITGVVWQPEK